MLLGANILTLRRLSRAPRPGNAPRRRVSVVIPARDEERAVAAAVASHLAQDYPDFEVVVVDDRSTDGTREILRRAARADPRLRVVEGVEPPAGWLGKPHALFQGAAAASGGLLFFADADVRYAPTALGEAVAILEACGLSLLAIFPRLEMEGFWENVLMPNLAVSYFFGPGVLLNSDLQKRFAVGAGAGMLVDRRAYEAAGGHAALRESVIDDLHLAIRIRRSGGRCRMVLADDRARLRMYHGLREIVDGFTKNISFVFEGWTGVALAASTLFVQAASILPPSVLAAAAFGFPVARHDVLLAALACGATVAARGVLAMYLGHPLWTALTQPIMAVVWTAIIARSFTRRFLRREVLWRGRRYDAARARF